MNTQTETGLEAAYEVKTLESKTVGWEKDTDFGKVFNDIVDGDFVLWLHHGVFIGEVVGGQPVFGEQPAPVYDNRNMVRLRVFNANKEWHLWGSHGGVRGRLRDDTGGGDKTQAIETQMVVRGVVKGQLPLATNDKKWAIKTLNYIDKEQAGYVDSRFVGFVEI